MKYKVTVQPIGEGADDTPQELLDGALGDGYLIIIKRKKTTTVALERMSYGEIAFAFAGDEDLLLAARIAKKIGFFKRRNEP